MTAEEQTFFASFFQKKKAFFFYEKNQKTLAREVLASGAELRHSPCQQDNSGRD
jgi:hypothetical protein